MAQTIVFYGVGCGTLEVSTGGTTYTDVSGSTISVQPGEQPILTGEQHTLEGHNPIITSGKLGGIPIVITATYNQEAAEAYTLLKTYVTGCNSLYIRWSFGGTAGDPLFTTGKSVMASSTLPGLDSNSGDSAIAGFSIIAPSVAETTVPA